MAKEVVHADQNRICSIGLMDVLMRSLERHTQGIVDLEQH